LGYGTSRLHYLRKKERQRILEKAAELGIKHFDTAPSYGDGMAETELGDFLRGRRDQFVIATKYGEAANPITERFPVFGFPLRGLRAATRRVGFWEPPTQPFTAMGLRNSVEKSLERLRTGWLDIVLLHAPRLDRIDSVEAILEQFNALREKGLIRAYGLAGDWADIKTILSVCPELCQILQTAEADWQMDFPPDITFGALSPGPQSYWTAPTPPETALRRLAAALTKRQGVILVSTTRPVHLKSLVHTQREIEPLS
jgi:aryl-alcohol dehydrogenase-like predicted oxidoreductase